MAPGRHLRYVYNGALNCKTTPEMDSAYKKTPYIDILDTIQ